MVKKMTEENNDCKTMVIYMSNGYFTFTIKNHTLADKRESTQEEIQTFLNGIKFKVDEIKKKEKEVVTVKKEKKKIEKKEKDEFIFDINQL